MKAEHQEPHETYFMKCAPAHTKENKMRQYSSESDKGSFLLSINQRQLSLPQSSALETPHFSKECKTTTSGRAFQPLQTQLSSYLTLRFPTLCLRIWFLGPILTHMSFRKHTYIKRCTLELCIHGNNQAIKLSRHINLKNITPPTFPITISRHWHWHNSEINTKSWGSMR